MPRFLLLVIVVLFMIVSSFNGQTPPAPVADSAAGSELTTDSAYRQFVLDSIRLEANVIIDRIDATQERHVQPEAIIGVLIPIVVLIVVFLYLWRASESKKAVRLAMIEKGMDPSLMNDGNENSRKYGALRIGLLLAGLGMGLLVGFAIAEVLQLWDKETVPLIIISSALLFGGSGLIVYHRLVAKIESDRKG
jgi:hypothetical protein